MPSSLFEPWVSHPAFLSYLLYFFTSSTLSGIKLCSCVFTCLLSMFFQNIALSCPLHNLRHLEKHLLSSLQQIIHEYIQKMKWRNNWEQLGKSHNPVWDIIFMSWKAFCKCCSQSTAVGSGAQSVLVIGHSRALRVCSRSGMQTPCLQAPRLPPAPTLPFLTLPLRIRTSWIREV